MRFHPFLLLGVLALSGASQFSSTDISNAQSAPCLTRAQSRRAEREIVRGRTPRCTPAKQASSSSIAIAPGSRTGVACPDIVALRNALRMMSLGRPFACDPKVPTLGATSSSASSQASAVPHTVTTDQADTTLKSQFLLLGRVSPVLGAAKLFIEEEPLDVRAVAVNITAEVPGVQSLLVYDQDRRYLGRANLNTASSTNRNYRLSLPSGLLEIPKRGEKTLYFRAQLSAHQAGGSPNQTVQISNVVIEGNGVWSSGKYTKQSSSSDQFPAFLTSRSTILSVKNAGDATGGLTSGTNKQLASFLFAGEKSDSSAQIDLTSIQFQIEQTGNVTLQNVRLRTSGLPDFLPCSVTASTVTCTSIPDSFGSLSDAPRTLDVYADVILSTEPRATLRLSINETGSPLSAGAVSWTDGTATYSWVAVEGPIAQGTYWKY